MHVKRAIPILASIVVGVIIISIVLASPKSSLSDGESDFAYSDSQTLKNILDEKNIFMSSPTKISDYTVKQYCMYFDEQNKQQIMKQCLTSAIADSNGNPLGNINIGGDAENALMAIALVESSPFLDSQANTIDVVFETMVDTLVCDCWEQKRPGGFESVKQWLNEAKNHHVDSGKSSTKSKISGIAGKDLILEITKTENSYLWTLIVIK